VGTHRWLELTLYFVRGGGANPFQISVARRASTATPFGPAANVFDDSVGETLAPYVTPEGDELYFARVVPGKSSTEDLYQTPIRDGGAGPLTALDNLNTTSTESDPTLSMDRRTLYFYSDRARPEGLGAIFVAHRAAPGAKFDSPTEVQELAPDAGFTSPGWVSADLCRLYFYSGTGTSTSVDVMVAVRSPR
jgi:hypothetical protein